jgi:hypothetical protein
MLNGGAAVMVSDYEDDEDMEYDDDPDYDGPMDGTSVLYSELLLLCRVAFTVTVSPGMSWIHGKRCCRWFRTCVRFMVFTCKRRIFVFGHSIVGEGFQRTIVAALLSFVYIRDLIALRLMYSGHGEEGEDDEHMQDSAEHQPSR